LEFDYEFFKDIVIVIVPIIITVFVGAITATKITNKWRIQTEINKNPNSNPIVNLDLVGIDPHRQNNM